MPNVDWLWYGHGPVPVLARGALTPVEWLYRGVIALRSRAFDSGRSITRPALPCLSIGNVTVGGTGKTPLAAYAAQRLQLLSARPAVVLRGYGGDEPLVHRELNPGALVVVDGDRVRAVREAQQRGADLCVLDDAFQHRRVARVADIVVVSADQPWSDRCLPAGPCRERWPCLTRAHLTVVTSKRASPEVVGEVVHRVSGHGARKIAVAAIRADGLVEWGKTGARQSLAELSGTRVLAFAGIGNPDAFFGELEEVGAKAARVAFADHHAYAETDVRDLVRRAAGMEVVVCTLKDAVKLSTLWPRSGPSLWYVSQRVEWVDSEQEFEGQLRRVLDARVDFQTITAP